MAEYVVRYFSIIKKIVTRTKNYIMDDSQFLTGTQGLQMGGNALNGKQESSK